MTLVHEASEQTMRREAYDMLVLGGGPVVCVFNFKRRMAAWPRRRQLNRDSMFERAGNAPA